MIHLTKLDAAQRQLRTAIHLFFEERDPVSIYALASAAQDVFRDLLRTRGIPSPSLKDSDLVPPDKQKLWNDAMRHSQNFLKHADRDPDRIMVFNPDVVPYILYDVIVMYPRLTDGRMIREGLAFGMWFVFHNPQFLHSSALTDLATFEDLRSHASSRQDFLRLLERPELWPKGLD